MSRFELIGAEIGSSIARITGVILSQARREDRARADQFINTIRRISIMQGNEMDYTTMINFFAEYGIRIFLENSNDPVANEVSKKIYKYDELKEYSFFDAWKDFDELREFKKRYQMK